MASPFDPIITVATNAAIIGGVILSIAAIFAAVYVVRVGAKNVLAALRGEAIIYKGQAYTVGSNVRFYKGNVYSLDVWESAMKSVERQHRLGVRLDRESRNALRDYQQRRRGIK